MNYTVYQASRKGGRENNEDRIGYAYNQNALMMMLADGMGGHEKGEIASQLLVQTVAKTFEARADAGIKDAAEFLLDAIYAAHEAVNEYAMRHAMAEPPRTTCVVALVQHGQATWAHVGDSRLYHFSGDHLVSRTVDHTLVQQMVDDGLISEEDMAVHPKRNQLTNSIGGLALPNIELSSTVTLRNGDFLLLCSDGFWAEVTNSQMLTTLRSFPLERAINHMMDHVEFTAGKQGDNLSVVAARYGDGKVATKAMPPEGATTQGGTTTLLCPPDGDSAMNDLSDPEIEKAIAEIQAALRKHDPKGVK